MPNVAVTLMKHVASLYALLWGHVAVGGRRQQWWEKAMFLNSKLIVFVGSAHFCVYCFLFFGEMLRDREAFWDLRYAFVPLTLYPELCVEA